MGKKISKKSAAPKSSTHRRGNKNKISIWIKGEQKPDFKGSAKEDYYQGQNSMDGEPKKLEEQVAPCLLISRVNYPVDLTYNGEDLRFSPRQRGKFADISKLGSLPKGLFLKPLKK